MIARVFSLIATVIFALSSVHAQTPAANSFVGTWKLIAADKLLPDGTRAADYGTQPHGLAIFTADGHFMVEVFRDVRVKFASNDRAKGTPEEYKDASLSASCSFGTYSVDPPSGKVTMKIDRSTFPNYDDATSRPVCTNAFASPGRKTGYCPKRRLIAQVTINAFVITYPRQDQGERYCRPTVVTVTDCMIVRTSRA